MAVVGSKGGERLRECKVDIKPEVRPKLECMDPQVSFFLCNLKGQLIFTKLSLPPQLFSAIDDDTTLKWVSLQTSHW